MFSAIVPVVSVIKAEKIPVIAVIEAEKTNVLVYRTF